MVSSILISSIMVVYLVKYGNCNNLVVEEEPYIVYRPGSSFLCPPRAVCADEFTYRRTLNNETTILKRRIFNCRCDHISHDACPITAENMIYASEINKQFLCRPIATLPECNEQENPDRIAQELEDKSPIFFNRNYYRIKVGLNTPRSYELEVLQFTAGWTGIIFSKNSRPPSCKWVPDNPGKINAKRFGQGPAGRILSRWT